MGGKRSHEHTLLAPRTAGETIRQVRSKFGLTTTQFGKLLGDTLRALSHEARSSLGVKQLVELEPSSRTVTRWEEGLARVPMQAYAISKGLYDQRLREEEGLPAAPPPARVAVTQQYPHQESMIGAEFQTTVPKFNRAAKASTRTDAVLFSPRTASRELGRQGTTVDRYLKRVRELIEESDSLCYD